MGDVEVDKAIAPFIADGVKYSEGSYFIRYAQPYGKFAKALLEKQVYPDLRDNPDMPPKVPYDVTGHTLSLQLGVNIVEVSEVFDAALEIIENPELETGVVNGKGRNYVFDCVPNYTAKVVNKLLNKGYTVSRSLEELELGDEVLKQGAFIVETNNGLVKLLDEMANSYGLDFTGIDIPLKNNFELSKPKIGLYRAWLPNADEGWLRMVFDEYGFDYVNLYPEDIRSGKLRERINVLIVPDLTDEIMNKGMQGIGRYDPSMYERKYTQGIGEKGNKEIMSFLDSGGTVITLNRSCEYAVKSLWADAELPLEGLEEKDFYCPGSLLRVLVDDTHPIGFGFSREETIMFLHSPVFNIKFGESVAWYPEANPLISGWVLGEKHLRGHTAVAEIPAGNGSIIMIGFPPHFRNQNRATFKFLFNSIYYGAT
jgi:hypothetical protein